MERFGKFLLYFVYLAITWDMGCFQQYCGGGLKFSPHDHLNIARNCTVDFDCQSPVTCVLDILYNEVNSSGDLTPIDRNTCDVANETSLLKCPKNFSNDSYAYCRAFSSNGTQTNSTVTQIIVFDHLDEVKNMHKNDTDCIVWSQPPSHTDIELEYGIKFMYYNGTVIDNTTSNLTEYCLTNITFDECKLVSVSVVAKAVCGDASSNITWWNGSVLESRIPWNSFNVSLAMVESGVAIYISYIEKITSCASFPLLLYANLNCDYENKGKRSYEIKLIQHENYTQLIHSRTNESNDVLLPNEKAKCGLTLYGEIEQWTRNISTLRVKNCSESKSTHICVEFQFLKGLPECSAPLTPNIPRKNYPFELNIDKSDECFRHSLLDESDQSKCCVSCDGNHYCRSADYNNNDVAKNNEATLSKQVLLGVILLVGAFLMGVPGMALLGASIVAVGVSVLLPGVVLLGVGVVLLTVGAVLLGVPVVGFVLGVILILLLGVAIIIFVFRLYNSKNTRKGPPPPDQGPPPPGGQQGPHHSSGQGPPPSGGQGPPPSGGQGPPPSGGQGPPPSGGQGLPPSGQGSPPLGQGSPPLGQGSPPPTSGQDAPPPGHVLHNSVIEKTLIESKMKSSSLGTNHENSPITSSKDESDYSALDEISAYQPYDTYCIDPSISTEQENGCQLTGVMKMRTVPAGDN